MNFVEKQSDTLDVLLHGSAGGMTYSLMQKIFDVCVAEGHSVANFNFPYFERGEEHSSGPELKEELQVLSGVLKECHAEKYSHVRLIGKSLGGIIAAKYASELPTPEQKKYSVVIFGYIPGSTILNDFHGEIATIQGEKDKYGGVEIVKQDLKNSVAKDILYFGIPDADHSYRNENKEPIYEDAAIGVFKKI